MELNEVETDILTKVREAIELETRQSRLKCANIERDYENLQIKYEQSRRQIQEMKLEMDQLRKQLYEYIRKEQVSSPILDDRHDQRKISDYFQTSNGVLNIVKLEPGNKDNVVKLARDKSRFEIVDKDRLGVRDTDTDTKKNTNYEYEDENVFSSPNKRLKFQSFNGVLPKKSKPELKSKSFANIPFDKLPTQYSDDESSQSSPIRISPRKKDRKNNTNINFNSSQKSLKSIKFYSSPEKVVPKSDLSLVNLNSMGNIELEKSQNILECDKILSHSLKSSPEADINIKKPLLNPDTPLNLINSSPDAIINDLQDNSIPSSLEDEVSDSQEDFDEIFDCNNLIVIPQPNLNTTLQNREYIRKYLQQQYDETEDKINLTEINPITQKHWIISDFKQNPNFEKQNYKLVEIGNNTTIKRKLGFNQQHEEKIQLFYNKINCQNQVSTYEEDISQFFDKFQSPPGFMQSEFPNTQELIRRKHIIQERQSKRIKRRIRSCLTVKEHRQTGEFIFAHEILNKYVINNRYIFLEQIQQE